MFHGVTYVDSSYSPIIHEGPTVNVVVLNAGPATVLLNAWTEVPNASDKAPNLSMELRPGNSRSIGGSLIRAKIKVSEQSAALGWRIIEK
jgi:hypothetical protein